MRRVSQPTTEHHSIKPLSSQYGAGGSSSQTELRRLRVGGSRESNADKILLSPNESKITSFAQSVLALHKLQDNTGAHRSKRNSKSYFDSGSGLSGIHGYRVGNMWKHIAFEGVTPTITKIDWNMFFNFQDDPWWSYGQSNLRPLHGSIPNTGNTSSMLSLHKITSPPQKNIPSHKRHSRPSSGTDVASTFVKLFHHSKDCLPEWSPEFINYFLNWIPI